MKEALFVQIQACAASTNVSSSQDLHSQTVLRSLLTDTSLLQFAAADSHGVMVCVSMSKRLKGPVADFVCKAHPQHLIQLLLPSSTYVMCAFLSTSQQVKQ